MMRLPDQLHQSSPRPSPGLHTSIRVQLPSNGEFRLMDACQNLVDQAWILHDVILEKMMFVGEKLSV